MPDLVIRDVVILDGTGSEPVHGDVAVDDGLISTVGEAVRGRREVDAARRHLLPGWVDIHAHYDGQVTWDPQVSPSSRNGITTVVRGNCGVGFAPVRPRRASCSRTAGPTAGDLRCGTIAPGKRADLNLVRASH